MRILLMALTALCAIALLQVAPAQDAADRVVAALVNANAGGSKL